MRAAGHRIGAGDGRVCASTPAFGQAGPATTAETAAPIETVVVTGIRASLKSAQSIKKNADQIVNSITAVDIGALPDRSVAEALQRVPGVTVQRTDQNRDPVRFAGSPNTVFIRGLSWVQSELNGRDVFSASDGRSLSFGDISSDLLAGVDVYKNPDAKMIEGGVGGTVDLRTRHPFDQDGLLAAISAEYDTGNLYPKSTPSANALVSDRWDTKIGEIGALLSVDYQDLGTRSNGFAFDHYDCVDIVNNAVNGITRSAACNAVDPANQPVHSRYDQLAPDRLGTEAHGIGRRCSSGVPPTPWNSRLMRSSASPTRTTSSTRSRTTARACRSTIRATNIRRTAPGSAVPSPTPRSRATRASGAVMKSTGSYSWNAKFTPNNSWTVTGDIEYIESEATNYSMTGFTGLADCGGFNSGSGIKGPCETLTVNIPGKRSSFISQTPKAGTELQNNYFWLAMMDHHGGQLRPCLDLSWRRDLHLQR